MGFRLAVNYRPRGDQENAIAELTRGVRDGEQHQVLLGVTGFGQDLHHGEGHRGHRPPGAGAGAQQDARRPALSRVQIVFPR